MKKVVEIVHDIMKSQLTENSICADFTMGQGYDTLFLAQQKNCSHIYAFDIQPQAYVQTREKLESAQLEGKATLILVLYWGQACNREESEALLAWSAALQSRCFSVCRITMHNKQNCPDILVISKEKEKVDYDQSRNI